MAIGVWKISMPLVLRSIRPGKHFHCTVIENDIPADARIVSAQIGLDGDLNMALEAQSIETGYTFTGPVFHDLTDDCKNGGANHAPTETE